MFEEVEANKSIDEANKNIDEANINTLFDNDVKNIDINNNIINDKSYTDNKAKAKAKSKAKTDNDVVIKNVNKSTKADTDKDVNKNVSSNQFIKVLDEYFDSKFNSLENNNKVIDLSKRDIINYEEQIIKIKKGQRLILQIV